MDNFKIYLKEVKKYTELPEEQTVNLIRQYQSSKDKLSKGYLRFVLKIAVYMSKAWPNCDVMDFIQEGNTVMLSAIDKYDPYGKAKFTSYLGFAVRSAMLQYIKDTIGPVKLFTTREQRYILSHLIDIRNELERDGVDVHVVAKQFGVSSYTLAVILNAQNSVDICDVNECDMIPYTEPTTPEEDLIQKEGDNNLAKKIQEFLKPLSRREVLIFRDYIMLGEKSLASIAREEGVVRATISATHIKLLEKARSFFSREDFEYLNRST
jgi:RNA polymerase sigma factor (sigma-70 family)